MQTLSHKTWQSHETDTLRCRLINSPCVFTDRFRFLSHIHTQSLCRAIEMSSGRLIGQWEAHWEEERWWKDVLEKQVRSPHCVQAQGQAALYRVLNSVFVPASLWIWVNSRTLFPLTTICLHQANAELTSLLLSWSPSLMTLRQSDLFLSLVFSSFTPSLLSFQVQLSLGRIFLLIQLWTWNTFWAISNALKDCEVRLISFNSPGNPKMEKQ